MFVVMSPNALSTSALVTTNVAGRLSEKRKEKRERKKVSLGREDHDNLGQ